LILDGTEEAKDLRKVLNVRGGCGVLVTSRARRDALAERQDVDPLEANDAVDLLRRWGGDLAADDHAAARICRLTGYLPLAVKLAGRFLGETGETAAEYVEWLEETPLEALNHGDRRTESVDVLLEKSLEQVSDEACRVLGVVGLLALAPFDRDPIAAALQARNPKGLISFVKRFFRQKLEEPKLNLHRALGELVSYGLLARSGERYEVSHALVHTYARKRVEPEDGAVARLAAYYDALAREQRERGLPGYRRLDIERSHIMRVLRTCTERDRWEAVDRLAWALTGEGSFLRMQGYWTDLVTAIETGLAAAQNLNNRQGEGAHLGNLGLAYSDLGQVEKAIDYYEQALAIARDIGYQCNEGSWLGNLGLAYRDLGQIEKAIDYYEQALAIARDIDYRRNEGIWLGNLGLAYRDLGQVEKAVDYFEQALTIVRDIGYQQGEGNWLGNLGLAYRNLGQVEKAVDCYQQALAIARDIGHRRNEGIWLGNLGLAYHDFGQVVKAIGHYEKALTIARDIGHRLNEGIWLGNLGNAYSDLGQVEKAINYYEQALDITRDIAHRRNEGVWLGNLGNAYRTLGQTEKAIDHYEEALSIAREVGHRQGEANHLGNLGNAYRDLGQMERAIECYEQALTITRRTGYRRNEGVFLNSLGNAYRALGQIEKAERYLEQSLSIFEEIKSPNADLARGWLAELESGEKQ
jgi:tetratricopeptide (TPR) repeat protein